MMSNYQQDFGPQNLGHSGQSHSFSTKNGPFEGAWGMTLSFS